MNISNLKKIYDHLTDEKSRTIFEARMEYSVKRDRFTLLEKIVHCESSFKNIDIERIKKQSRGKNIIIYGAGNEGKHVAYVLEHSELAEQIVLFADQDSNKWGKSIGNYNVISPFELKNMENCYIVVASIPYGAQMYQDVAKTGFPQESIYLPPFSRILGETGKQYFDVFQPSNDEVFLDVGCYDGNTSVDFAKWCGGKYEKIIAIEADKRMIKRCNGVMRSHNITNYELINKACWSEQKDIGFDNDITVELSGNSKINNESNNIIRADSIDNILNGERASFIKMDIEGAELEGLKGAENTILKYHPKLAICVYHKPQDIYEIPEYILKIDPKYCFTLRHYSSDEWETVLFAQ